MSVCPGAHRVNGIRPDLTQLMKFLYHDEGICFDGCQLRELYQTLKYGVDQTGKETAGPEVCFTTFVFASIWARLGYPFWKLSDRALDPVSMNPFKVGYP